MTKPIKPSEVAKLKEKVIPEKVIDCINKLIAKNFNSGYSKILRAEAKKKLPKLWAVKSKKSIPVGQTLKIFIEKAVGKQNMTVPPIVKPTKHFMNLEQKENNMNYKLKLTNNTLTNPQILDELPLGELSEKELETLAKVLNFLERKFVTNLTKSLEVVES